MGMGVVWDVTVATLLLCSALVMLTATIWGCLVMGAEIIRMIVGEK